MTSTQRLSWEDATRLTQQALLQLGYDGRQAAVIARHLVSAQASGSAALGLSRVLWIKDILDSGAPRGDPSEHVVAGPGATVVDGHGGIGYLAAERAIAGAQATARTSGVAVGVVRNVFLTGALRQYCSDLADAGCASVIVSSAAPALLAPGPGGKRVMGTNPLAIGVPGTRFPVVFDSSSSDLPYSEVVARAAAGQPLPAGVGLDASGEPTRDAQAVVDGGSLLGWAGHRGFALALVVQALAMTAGIPPTAGSLADCAMVAIVVDPTIWGADPNGVDVMALIGVVGRASADGSGRIPGQHRATALARARDGGVDVRREVVEALRRLADGA